jgi:FAD/FMN-containing dehydrogenase
VSVPLSQIPHFIDEASRRLHQTFHGVRIDAFGHMGDGNIHFDVLSPPGGDQATHAGNRDAGARLVHGLVVDLGGSISAEHGLGSMKTAEAAALKSAVELDTLRAIRAAIDPKRIMNPRVLF